MELEKKQEEVTKLYALRGGLSVLSEIYDEACLAKKRIEQTKDEIQLCEEKIEYEGLKASKQTEEINHEISEQEEVINDQEYNLRKVKYEIKEDKKDITIGLILLIIYIPIAIIGINELLNLFDIHAFWAPVEIREPIYVIMPVFLTELLLWLASLLALPSPIVIFFALAIIISTAVGDKKKLNNAYNALNNAKNTLKEMEENRDKENRKINAYCYNKTKEQFSVIENHKVAIHTEETNIAEIKKRFDIAHKAVQEQFGAFLDERDWGNVDLIIFNYETGRAIDMRDALLQVDNERRNERLVKAVEDASVAIGSSINRGFGALQGALTEQFDMLDRRISGFSSQVERISQESKAQLAEQTAAMEAKLGQIAEISSAQTALLNKMNVSSDKMANDIEDMRRLANYTYYET